MLSLVAELFQLAWIALYLVGGAILLGVLYFAPGLNKNLLGGAIVVSVLVRESQATNIGEFQQKGWAFGKIADMRAWYARLVADPRILGGSGLGTDAVHREPAMTNSQAGTVEASGQSETQHD